MPYKIVRAFGEKRIVWEDDPVDENFEVHSICECGREFILSPKSTGSGKYTLIDVMKHIEECGLPIKNKTIEIRPELERDE